MKNICHLSYRIPFSETDAMGIVHHSNHAKYFERGRIEFLRLAEMDYAGIVKGGIHFPVTEMLISYKKPLSFDEIILIETSISSLSRVRLNFSYSLFSLKQPLMEKLTNQAHKGPALVTAETKHCSINASGKPVEMPKELFHKLSTLFEGSLP